MKFIKKLFSSIGPGFITGAADDDPSGIATYSQTGAMFGFSQLWTAIASFPMMACIQEMCARIGIITGKGLTAVIKEHYSKKVVLSAVILLTIANAFNIGANLGAMAAAVELIIPIPFSVALIGMSAGTLLLEILVPYATYARYLKYLALALFAYIITAFFVTVDWSEVFFATLLPNIHFSKDYLMNITAILGTTISPYLFFWQTNQEVEEKQARISARTIKQQLTHSRINTVFGMFFSNLIMWFIIVTTGASLFKNGIYNISTAHEAALALKPFAGDFAFLLFAIGIIGTGLLAVPILAGSVAYAVSEMMGWPCSLAFTYGDGKKFYQILSVVIIAGTFVNFLPISSITLLYYSAILNGLIAPILIFIILAIAGNKKIMGEYTNNRYNHTLGTVTGVVMSVIAIALIGSWFL